LGKTLMIIGAGVEQVPAYEAAKRRGLTIVGTDMNPDAPGFALADRKILVSTRDAESTCRKAVRFHQEHPLHGVMTIANDVPFTVALTAQTLGLPSISLDSARCVVDKVRMKQCFSASDVACPWFAEVESVEALRRHLQAKPGQSHVLKPVDGRGARGVLLLNEQIDLNWAFAESKRWGDSGRLILEEFIPGLQLSTESYILEGQCYTPAMAERNYSRLDEFRPNIIEDGGTIPPPIDDATRVAVNDLILRGATALGITAGIVKGDIVIAESGRPLIIELAARLSGGWFATHQIPAASGVSLVDAVISFALGEPISAAQLQPTRNRATAIRYWFPPAGTIQSIEGEEKLQTTPGLLKYDFFRKVGEVQPEIRMHPDRFGFVIVEGDNREEALSNVAQALACVTVRIQ